MTLPNNMKYNWKTFRLSFYLKQHSIHIGHRPTVYQSSNCSFAHIHISIIMEKLQSKL